MDGVRYSQSFRYGSSGGQRIVTSLSGSIRFFIAAISAPFLLTMGLFSQDQATTLPNHPRPSTALSFDMPKSHNPLNAYQSDSVPEPVLTNSSRLDQLVRD